MYIFGQENIANVLVMRHIQPMRGLLYLIICSLLAQCSSIEIDTSWMVINSVDQPPTDHDRCKFLKIVNPATNEVLDQETLYCDYDHGCTTFLYDVDNYYILIDCNGQWFRIVKASGAIEKEQWSWQKPLPTNYLGTFVISPNDSMYTLRKGVPPTIETVYQYKDPL